MEKYFGRLLLKKDINSSVSTDNFAKIAGMIELNNEKIRCARCGTEHQKPDVQLAIGSFYCPTCINLGRVRSDEFLYQLPQKTFPQHSYLRWDGTLITYQQKISDTLVSQTKNPSKVLVQAVTGSGKTEMTYSMIEQCLKNGGTVAFVSPRIDVCIELHKRLSHDFYCEIPLLHGAGQPYFRAPLIIATTHQLLRFREAFDLLIVDEVDAFPFVDDPMLYFAVEKARKLDSSLVYLTATSTDFLDKQVKKRVLHKLELSHRFHGNPLIVPQFFWQTKFIKLFKKQRATGFPLLIFAPVIAFGENFAQDLQKQFPDEKIAFVASTTKNRLEIVEKFRTGSLSVLVSTTILERGVTFPSVDVFVIKAEHQNFTKSALIQIAGRVGRSQERPDGLVYFFHEGRTKAMVRAVQEIKKSNQKGVLS